MHQSFLKRYVDRFNWLLQAVLKNVKCGDRQERRSQRHDQRRNEKKKKVENMQSDSHELNDSWKKKNGFLLTLVKTAPTITTRWSMI